MTHNKDFINKGELVYWARPKCYALPVIDGIIKAVHKGNTVTLDVGCGQTTVNTEELFKTEAEAEDYCARNTKIKTADMRNRNMRDDMCDIHILQNWLCSDKNNTITIENCMHGKIKLTMNKYGEIKLTMNKYGEIMAINTASTDQTLFHYDNMLSTPIWLGIIEQLKKQKPRNRSKFTNKWDEITTQ